MTITGAPWWAKLLSILMSQVGLAVAQYLAFLQQGGAAVTLGIAVLQAIQGSIAAYGLDPWRAAGGLVVRAGEAVRRSREREIEAADGDHVHRPQGGPGPGGPA